MTTTLKRWGLASLPAIALLTVGSVAWAEWGDGVQGGPFRLHPGVSLSAGFDSNLYYGSSNRSSNIMQAPEGTVEPVLSLLTVEPSSWKLEGEAAVGWRQYFSQSDSVRRQSGLSAMIDASAWWNADGAVSLRFTENFVRTTETPNYVSPDPINRVFNRAGIMLGVHPGGRVLETYASYDFSLYRHNRYTDLDRHTHTFGWNGRWSFLPKTSVAADVDFRMISYNEPFVGADRVPNPDQRIKNSDSMPLRMVAGLDGLLTRRLSLGLRAGYGMSFYEEGPDFKGLLAKAEASFQFGRVEYENRLRAGYERGFNDSSLGNYYTYHRGVVGYEQGLINNRLRLSLSVDAQQRDYSELGITVVETAENVITIPDLSDLLLGVNAETGFQIRKGWNLGIRYSFRSNFTEDVIEVVGPGETTLRDYQRHHVLLSTELKY